MLPPLPADGFRVVPFDVLEVALAKLDIKVPLNDIIAVAREEETKRRKAKADATERRAVLAKWCSTATSQPSGMKFTTTSEFIQNPPPRAEVDPLAKERRRRLVELAEEAFSDGKVQVPNTCSKSGKPTQSADTSEI